MRSFLVPSPAPCGPETTSLHTDHQRSNPLIELAQQVTGESTHVPEEAFLLRQRAILHQPRLFADTIVEKNKVPNSSYCGIQNSENSFAYPIEVSRVSSSCKLPGASQTFRKATEHDAADTKNVAERILTFSERLLPSENSFSEVQLAENAVFVNVQGAFPEPPAAAPFATAARFYDAKPWTNYRQRRAAQLQELGTTPLSNTSDLLSAPSSDYATDIGPVTAMASRSEMTAFHAL